MSKSAREGKLGALRQGEERWKLESGLRRLSRRQSSMRRICCWHFPDLHPSFCMCCSAEPACTRACVCWPGFTLLCARWLISLQTESIIKVILKGALKVLTRERGRTGKLKRVNGNMTVIEYVYVCVCVRAYSPCPKTTTYWSQSVFIQRAARQIMIILIDLLLPGKTVNCPLFCLSQLSHHLLHQKETRWLCISCTFLWLVTEGLFSYSPDTQLFIDTCGS